MKKLTILIGILAFIMITLVLVILLEQEEKIILNDKEISQPTFQEDNIKIASWLAKKDEIISSGKPYDLIMTGWVTSEEAKIMRANNPEVIILAGLTTKFVYDSPEWMGLLTNVANYGKENSILITEDMYLKRANGERCSFGWASEEFATNEIYAMDPRNDKWADLVVSFYEKVLEQPQHDGIIIDMVTEWVPCEDARISKQEWIDFDKKIMGRIKKANKDNKLIIFNSGKDLSEINSYVGYFDGYLMENALGEWGVSFEEGLRAGKDKYIVIYNIDTDDTGLKDLNKMRSGLTLSLLNDNTYFTYDFGPRNHGQAWWFPEYDTDLGKPMGEYYEKDNAYYRDFEKGIVVSSPKSDTIVSFEEEYIDLTTGILSRTFTIYKGDGRIFVK